MQPSLLRRPLLLLHLLTWLLAGSTPAHAALESALESATERLIPAAGNDTPALVDRLTHSLSAKQVRKVVQQAPEKLNLGTDNFLGSGLKRKSVSGAYGTTAAVAVGAAAITYQTMNLKSKYRDAEKKAETAQTETAAATDTGPEDLDTSTEYTASPASMPPLTENTDTPAQPHMATTPSSAPPVPPRSAAPRVPAATGTNAIYALPVRWTKRTRPSSRRYAYPPSRALSATQWSKRTPISDATLITIEDYNKMIGATEAIASGTIAVASA
ncbi:hypothetical protein EX895_004076 [Sporisorium graminicola]|uniref:Uncharacterized protein n=1 Tax=Sporisorium graminicola TaxID=280036 RepID=A0A4V6ETP1_9BASI|nr:hypothetical protein EX895_004076 [Sporisorium graminicola]TKY87399.1 hypothetical protein EX895_004076 [Sporisorium graminicola]